MTGPATAHTSHQLAGRTRKPTSQPESASLNMGGL